VIKSVDCLVPGLGKVVGSGMRIDALGDLLVIMRENKWDLEAYAFYL
jgi:asparaginyl-tRNA synthetase